MSEPVIDDGRRFHRDATGWRIHRFGLVLKWTKGLGKSWSIMLYRPTIKGQP